MRDIIFESVVVLKICDNNSVNKVFLRILPCQKYWKKILPSIFGENF
jgi:hypothetical protein